MDLSVSPGWAVEFWFSPFPPSAPPRQPLPFAFSKWGGGYTSKIITVASWTKTRSTT